MNSVYLLSPKLLNACAIANWQTGPQANPAMFTITQNGSSITGTVGGLGAVGVSLLLGSATFNGTVAGNDIDLTLIGTVPFTTNGCTYTYRSEITGTFANNALSGQIRYTTATNGAPSCSSLMSCVSFADYSGSRPPR